MSEQRHIEMRRRGSQSERVRRRTLVVAGIAGAAIFVAVIGAIIMATFPKGSPTTTASTTSGAPVSPATVTSVSATPASAKSKASKKAKKKHGSAAPAGPPKAPLAMSRTLPGSTQMIVATAPTLRATQGKLRVYNLVSNAWKRVFSAPCRFGSGGLVDGTRRKEGALATPTGIWMAGAFVWGWHPMAPSGTNMPYRQTTSNIWWSRESGSTYNTWVDSTQRVDGEHLVDARVQYEFAYSTGYNASPNQVVEGRGTAIFLHVFDPPNYHNGLSAGCVTLSRSDIIRVFTLLDPARKPSFAVGTDASGTPTSISSY